MAGQLETGHGAGMPDGEGQVEVPTEFTADDIKNALMTERKTKRMQIILQPLLKRLVVEKAAAENISGNELVCRMLAQGFVDGLAQKEKKEDTSLDTKERTERRLLENARQLDKIRLYTLTELESVLNCTHRTLHQYVKTGRLKAVKVAGKWKVTGENLNRFLQGT